MKIKQINIVCHSHYDMKGIEHPSVVSLAAKKVIDNALFLIDRDGEEPHSEKFSWTAEAIAPVAEWWTEASPEDRRKLLDAITNKRLEVCALPFNFSSIIGPNEVNKAVSWVSPELYQAFEIKTAIASGQDGISASLVRELVRRGLKYVWVLPEKNGVQIKDVPLIFNWKITASEHVLAFEGGSLNNFFEVLFPDHLYDDSSFSDLTSRCPDETEAFCITDENGEISRRAIAEAYVRLSNYIENIENSGEYPYSVLPMSFSGVWRGRNDPPAEMLTQFVTLWNRMELTPALHISTAAEAFASLEAETFSARIPTFCGQWTDTDFTRFASCPRQISAVRQASRLYEQIKALPGNGNKNENKQIEQIIRDVCCFYEHNLSSFGEDNDYDVSTSVSDGFAYRSLEKAKYILSERIKRYIQITEDGIYVYNPSPCKMIKNVSIVEKRLFGQYVSLMDRESLDIIGLTVDGKKEEPIASFAAEIPPYSVRYYAPMEFASPEPKEEMAPDMICDKNGWPLSFLYSNGDAIRSFNLGDVIFVFPKDGRGVYETLCSLPSSKRGEYRNEQISIVPSSYEMATTLESDRFLTITQRFSSSAGNGQRIMTVWKSIPRVNIRIQFEKMKDCPPVAIYGKFSLDTGDSSPVTSSGGLVFDPERGVLNGCRLDSIAIDGWVSYPYVKLLWMTKDTPFVSFGDMNYGEDTRLFSQNGGCVYSLLYDNTRSKGIYPDENGLFEFSFDLLSDDKADDFEQVRKLSEACFAEPIPLVRIHR